MTTQEQTEAVLTVETQVVARTVTSAKSGDLVTYKIELHEGERCTIEMGAAKVSRDSHYISDRNLMDSLKTAKVECILELPLEIDSDEIEPNDLTFTHIEMDSSGGLRYRSSGEADWKCVGDSKSETRT